MLLTLKSSMLIFSPSLPLITGLLGKKSVFDEKLVLVDIDDLGLLTLDDIFELGLKGYASVFKAVTIVVAGVVIG